MLKKSEMKIMSLIVLVAFVTGVTLLAGPAFAQKNKEKDASASAAAAAPSNGSYKIAVVDMGQLMKEYKKRQQKYDELQKSVESQNKEIEAMQKKIETAKAAYEAKRDKMSDDEKSAARLQIETDMATYKSELEKKQRQIDSNEEKVLKEVVGDIRKTIEDLAAKESYHLVLNSGGANPAVIYNSPTIDITLKVLEVLNK